MTIKLIILETTKTLPRPVNSTSLAGGRSRRLRVSVAEVALSQAGASLQVGQEVHFQHLAASIDVAMTGQLVRRIITGPMPDKRRRDVATVVVLDTGGETQSFPVIQ